MNNNNISESDRFIPQMKWNENSPEERGIRKYGLIEGAIREQFGKALKLTTEGGTVYLDKQGTIDFLARIQRFPLNPLNPNSTSPDLMRKITEKVANLANNPGSPISTLQGINEEVRLADKINSGKIPLKEVRDKYPEMLRRVAPYLEIVDLSDPVFHSLSHNVVFQFLEMCLNITSLNVAGHEHLRTLPDLPKLTSLCCQGCKSMEEIPRLPMLTSLDCTGCTGLKKIFISSKLVQLVHGCESLPFLPFELVDDHGILAEAKEIHHILSSSADDRLLSHRILDGTTSSKVLQQLYSTLKVMEEKSKDSKDTRQLKERIEDLFKWLNEPDEKKELSGMTDRLREMQSGDFFISAVGFTKHRTLACWEKIGDTYYCSIYDTNRVLGGGGPHAYLGSTHVLPLRFKYDNFEDARQVVETLLKARSEAAEGYYSKVGERNNLVWEGEYNERAGKKREVLDSAYRIQTVGTCGHESWMALIMDRLGHDKFKEFKTEELGQASELLDGIARKLFPTLNQTNQTTPLSDHETTLLPSPSTPNSLIRSIFQSQQKILRDMHERIREGSCAPLGVRQANPLSSFSSLFSSLSLLPLPVLHSVLWIESSANQQEAI